MSDPVVHISNLSLKYRHTAVLLELNWVIQRGENWLLYGPSGSGKTTLAKAIAGQVQSYGRISLHLDSTSNLPARVHYVDNWYQFKDLEGQSNFYYQQRYNKQSTEVTATVKTELDKYGKQHELDFDALDAIVEALGYAELTSSTLIQLSSGEHKKLQLIKALWLKPQLLILDQPYNGLDAQSRTNLNTLLDEKSAEGMQYILISNDPELPASLQHFAEIIDGQLVPQTERVGMGPSTSDVIWPEVPYFLQTVAVADPFSHVVRMKDVNITYGNKHVLKNINWDVRAGEKWLLQGPNGSGKSTLLSLLTGDHPQAYANEFYLFGNKRGSGESIWEIKKRIGMISPELHWYFDPSATVWQSVVSGFYDSAGLFCDPGYTKNAQASELISYFGLEPYKNVLVKELPLGKQRLALLARTIIKSPELLILDEPCQGLDQQQTRHFNKLVDQLCGDGTTLIYVGHFESALPGCIEKRIILEGGEIKSIDEVIQMSYTN